jgi:hypothetical protein
MNVADIPVALEAVRISPRPGDVILVKPQRDFLTTYQARAIQETLEAYLPDHRVCLIPFSADLAVLSAEDLKYLMEEDDTQ